MAAAIAPRTSPASHEPGARSWRASWMFRHDVLPVLVLCLIPLGCSGAAGSPEDRTITWRAGDLVAAGSSLAISDSIPGDAMLAAGDIEFAGVTGGDYLGAGASQRIDGRIGGDARAAGARIRLDAAVARNATLAGRWVVVGEGGSIGGNGYLAGQSVRLSGTADGFLQMVGQEAVIDGTVGGNVNVEADRLRVGPQARILGDLRYRVEPDNVVIAPGARVSGQTIALAPGDEPDMGMGGGGFFRAVWLIGFLAAGTVAVALFPGMVGSAAEALRKRPGASVGLGLLWIVVVPIVVAIVAVTVIGVPLAAIGLALYLISLYLGRAVLAVWFGRLVLRADARPRRGRLVLAFLIGGVALVLLALIPVAGPLIGLVATIFGLGALALAIWRRGAPAPEYPA